MPTYEITIGEHTELIDAETPAKARWQAVQHRLEWLGCRERKHLFDGVSVRKVAGAPYPLPATADEQAAAWNAKHPVGTVVRYWRGLRDGQPCGTGRTRSFAQTLGGNSAVVWIEGCSGSIHLTHVEAVND